MIAAGFEKCRPDLYEAALALFDANCPAFFAPNEREDFERFLLDFGADYRVAIDGKKVLAGFALQTASGRRAQIRWIMVHPEAHGAGLGRRMMSDAVSLAKEAGALTIDIAASHLSAPFFARFGAVERVRTPDGWGPGMHRVDMTLSVAG